MRRTVTVRILAAAALLALTQGTSRAITIDVTTGVGGSYLPLQSYNETRGVDVTVLTASDLEISSMTLDALNVGADGTAAVGARIYTSPSGTLIASRDTTVKANGPVTLPISATIAAGQAYRICFFCGPLGPHEDNSATMFEPSSFPYDDSTGSLRINQAYESPTDSYPTNVNIFDPWIVLLAAPVAGVDSRAASPAGLAVAPASPNPFQANTVIRFELTRTTPAEAAVIDPAGRLIRHLLDRGAVAAGAYSIAWDGRDDGGRRVPSGAYFVRVVAEGAITTSRVELAR